MTLPHWTTLLREADGSVSSARVLMLFSGVAIIGTWAGKSIAADHLLDIPWGVVTVFGICCGLKWAQLKHESDGPAPDPPQS